MFWESRIVNHLPMTVWAGLHSPLCSEWARLSCFYVESFLSDKAGRTASKPAHHWQEIVRVSGVVPPTPFDAPLPHSQSNEMGVPHCPSWEEKVWGVERDVTCRKSCQSHPQGSPQPRWIIFGFPLWALLFYKCSCSRASEALMQRCSTGQKNLS